MVSSSALTASNTKDSCSLLAFTITPIATHSPRLPDWGQPGTCLPVKSETSEDMRQVEDWAKLPVNRQEEQATFTIAGHRVPTMEPRDEPEASAFSRDLNRISVTSSAEEVAEKSFEGDKSAGDSTDRGETETELLSSFKSALWQNFGFPTVREEGSKTADSTIARIVMEPCIGGDTTNTP
ncbi:unnamed protein product [Pleuronectes platessa]|uniref:Uncharacterized protein n=1 Tax=Pleuronectes platessa TaxID=8262 RepID=A0A9N7YHC3_PLEPL|nr:unnamed protein product [Pleuronectes platessa]